MRKGRSTGISACESGRVRLKSLVLGCVRSVWEGSESYEIIASYGGLSETHIRILIVIVPQHRTALCAEAALGCAHLGRLVVLIKLDWSYVLPGVSANQITEYRDRT
jgi:hypothetical protein